MFSYSALVALVLSSPAVAVDLIPIVGYFPGSSVVDHGNIDLDQTAMQTQIALKTSDGYAAGAAAYGEGGNSKAIATITLDAAASLVKSTKLTGTTISGGIASVSVFADTTTSATLVVKYADFLACQVGGLQSDVQNTDGCLASTGTITDGTTTYSYSGVVNSNARTLKGFSLLVASKMASEKHAIFNTNYYGFTDYADRWVTNALNGNGANDLNNFKADFDKYGDDGRIEGIKKGTAYMNVFLYAIHEFEAAIVKCVDGISLAQTDAIHAWDEGVAFFAGGLEGVDGSGSGALVYALGDKRCTNFGTCGPNGNMLEGTSFVNIELVKLFNQGFQELNAGDCGAAEETKDAIADLMYVPVVQGTIRYSWYKANGGSEKAQAEGATFAAACLARVHEADPAAAAIIASNMAISATTADSSAVKGAFESVYSSMNINCNLVGGLTDSETGEFQDGMEPCVTTCSESDTTSFSTDAGLITCGELSGFTADLKSLMCKSGGSDACPGICAIGGCTLNVTAPTNKPKTKCRSPICTKKPKKKKKKKKKKKAE